MKLFQLAQMLRISIVGESPKNGHTTVSEATLTALLQEIDRLKECASATPMLPEVAEEAADVISHLRSSLKATQAVFEKAARNEEEADMFAAQVAGLPMWGTRKANGEWCCECNTPAEGAYNSHHNLMLIIEIARTICPGNEPNATHREMSDYGTFSLTA